MLIPFILRLASEPLAAGRLCGQVEHVPTGNRAEFRDAEELRQWCARFQEPALAELPRQVGASSLNRSSAG